ncbi:MAG TPA: FAD-dependent oxidoreductase [Fimbriiglobus sp.]|jgi:glycine/D-amino acid oxidase-like deaminating enzyme/nitrite reductase/ring-hydroxylating ferredoxin subunit
MSVNTIPIWSDPPTLPLAGSQLGDNAECDVCVVGAGIAGLTTAYRLSLEGKKVLVLEARNEVGLGESAATSAHLSSVIDDRFDRIQKVRGPDAVRSAFESHAAAIDQVEATVTRECISCDFERVDGYLFPGDDKGLNILEREAEVCRAASIPMEWVDSLPWMGLRTGPALRFADQAQFHPRKYLTGLARSVLTNGGKICTGTRVQLIEGGRRPTATTAEGRKISAGSIVIATNTPLNGDVGINSRLAAYTTYAIAAAVPRSTATAALFWDTLDPYHYVRFHQDEYGQSFAIIGGEDHRTGQGQNWADSWIRLESWIRARFPFMGPIRYRWSGQVFETLDGLAYIGLDSSIGENVFLVTGDSGMGLTHGTIAGDVLTDLILGRENPWAWLYDPSRLPFGATGKFLRENVNSASQYFDWLTGGGIDPADLSLGEGTVVRRGFSKLAVCRTYTGELCMLYATCPHYGGLVRWNEAEQTWDCPLHGSRFSADGKVLHGPATADLKPASIEIETSLEHSR